jgi:hypothetical protein
MVDPKAKPISQKRKLGEERKKAIKQELEGIVKVGFIREIQYTTWLANFIMVKKANGKWQMCMDYTDLNKACPKDSYPLCSIDKLVDSTSGFQYISFIDANSGYNQIRMNPPDKDKTTFIVDTTNYCYRVMPFSLKNSRATYQRLMDKVFLEPIGKNIEVYIENMVVKMS